MLHERMKGLLINGVFIVSGLIFELAMISGMKAMINQQMC